MKIEDAAGSDRERPLTGRTAIVTGASQGIGEAVAWLFAEAGARLVLSEMDDAAAPVAALIAATYPDSGAVAVVTDVTDPVSVDALMTMTLERHGRLDVLAHATAIGQTRGSAIDLDPVEWDRVMAVNAKGPFLLCRAAVPAMGSSGGAIVFTGSFAGEQGQPGRAAYSASKGALRLFTQSLALELAEQQVRVNGVAPAFVESDLGRQGLANSAVEGGMSIEQAQATRDSAIPMKRQAEAREVAHAFLYLASDASAYVTGTWLDINGGLLVR